jgi:hypothetical protein
MKIGEAAKWRNGGMAYQQHQRGGNNGNMAAALNGGA